MKITIDSTDSKFMCRLLNFLNESKVEKDSTSIEIHEDKDISPEYILNIIGPEDDGLYGDGYKWPSE